MKQGRKLWTADNFGLVSLRGYSYSTISSYSNILVEPMIDSCVGLSCQGSAVSSLNFCILGDKIFSWMWISSTSDPIRIYAVMNYGISTGYWAKAHMSLNESNSNFYQRPVLSQKKTSRQGS